MIGLFSREHLVVGSFDLAFSLRASVRERLFGYLAVPSHLRALCQRKGCWLFSVPPRFPFSSLSAQKRKPLSMPIDTPARVSANQALSPGLYRIRLELEQDPGGPCLPGQFVMLRPRRQAAPYLRRAFALLSVQGTSLEVLIERRGEGTAALCDLACDDPVDVLVPLGNAWPLAQTKHAVLIAGGVGIAPMLDLAKALHKQGTQTTLCYGAPTAAKFVLLEAFAPFVKATLLATDDGSQGHRGFVTDVLPTDLDASWYACGPMGMLQTVAMRAEKRACWLSLEGRMACGFGVCVGCAVPVTMPDGTRGAKRVCADGPIFSAKELQWDWN